MSELTPDPEVARLAGWASGLPREEQDRLLLALANVLSSERLGPRSRALFERLIPTLASEAGASTRRELAQRLLDAPWAPQTLLAVLAAEGDHALRLELAARSALQDEAAGILLDFGSSDIALALAGNMRARLEGPALDRLMALARRDAALRSPLARRRDLHAEHAAQLAVVSSLPLRGKLQARFQLSSEAGAGRRDHADARRVVAKMGRARRLTPGYALGALRAGRLDVFNEAVAALGGFPEAALREPDDIDDPVPLALACVAGGLDRLVFPEVLRGVRILNGGRPGEAGADHTPSVIAALARTPEDASRALRDSHGRRTARWSAS